MCHGWDFRVFPLPLFPVCPSLLDVCLDVIRRGRGFSHRLHLISGLTCLQSHQP